MSMKFVAALHKMATGAWALIIFVGGAVVRKP
jgi:hypothetical protein